MSMIDHKILDIGGNQPLFHSKASSSLSVCKVALLAILLAQENADTYLIRVFDRSRK